jgi:hypothetical protein
MGESIKIGDRVRVVKNSGGTLAVYFGMEGEVVDIDLTMPWPADVEFDDDGCVCCFDLDELEVIR